MSIAVLLMVISVAIFADHIAPFNPTKIDVGEPLAGPSSSHWFGTDQFGRDVFSRVVYGTRVSLLIGISATLISVFVATIVGAMSGYFGGSIDYVGQRLVDAVQAIPPILLLVGIALPLGTHTSTVVITLSAYGALVLSRVIRGATIGVRNQSYIEASRAVGAPAWRIILFHVLPNIAPTAIILISTSIGGNIIAEASLSFLGLGVPPPNPAWGSMVSIEGRVYMLVNPWMLVFPVMALALVVFAVNMLGDSVRDELDPRLRGRQ